jgi:RNA polymerase sigma factor (sigma-70 family)
MTGPSQTQARVDDEFDDFYATQRIPMTRLAYLLTGSVAIAEEIVQDAFEQMVRRWAVIEQPAAYLRTSVVNGARSWGRRQRSAPNEPTHEQAPIDPDAISVRDALATLPHGQREALVLRYFAGMSDAEVAASTEKPLGTVKSNIRRGLDRMREALT